MGATWYTLPVLPALAASSIPVIPLPAQVTPEQGTFTVRADFAAWAKQSVREHKAPGYAIANISLKPVGGKNGTGGFGAAGAEQAAESDHLARVHHHNPVAHPEHLGSSGDPDSEQRVEDRGDHPSALRRKREFAAGAVSSSRTGRRSVEPITRSSS